MTSTLPTTSNDRQITLPSVPPLENGDRLTRPEFERRYINMTGLKKAELIEGVVYMASPLRFTPHAEPHGNVMGWLWTYKVATPQTQMGIEPTVRLDVDNEVQPDGVLFIRPECGGQVRLSEDGYLQDAPELVVEIAASSAAIDLGDKKRAYRRSGVQEYIVWQVCDRRIDWFTLDNGDYVALSPDEAGVISSPRFPGLRLDLEAMIQGNMAQVLTILQEGIQSTEHQQFVQEVSPN